MGALRTYKVQVTLEVEVRDDDMQKVPEQALEIMKDRINRRADRRGAFNDILKGLNITEVPY